MNHCQHNEIQIVPLLDTLQILDISDEEYFGEKYREYISNSRLKLIDPEEGGSPELFKAGLSPAFSDAFYYGSAIHCLTLQPDDFELVESVDRPTSKAGFMADELFKSFSKNRPFKTEEIIKASDKIGYYKGKMNENRIADLISKCSNYWHDRYDFEKSYVGGKELIYLDQRSRGKVHTSLKNIKSNTEIQKLLNPEGLLETPKSYNEATILLEVKAISPSKDETILKLKGKLDNFTVDEESKIITLNDLKTTGHYIEDFPEGSFVNFKYARQMAMYGWMLSLANKTTFNISNPTFKSNMLLVSSIPPCNCEVFSLNGSHINLGMKMFTDLLKRVAYLELYGN